VSAAERPAIPARLALSRTTDPGEREAERVADELTRERPLSLRAISDHPATGREIEVPPVVHKVLRSPGRPLDESTRQLMEPRFGHDFGRVRVHTDERAARSARAVHARAYTVGPDVVFGAGQFAPGTAAGRRLLAHELTHTIQQGGGLHPAVLQRAELVEDDPEVEPMECEADESEFGDDEAPGEGDLAADAGQLDEPLAMALPAPDDGGPKGKKKRKRGPKQNSTAKTIADCIKDFDKRNQEGVPRGVPESVRCVTRYRIDQEEVGAGSQPEVANQVTNQVFNLTDSACSYFVRWDMDNVPDQMIISDADSGALIWDSGWIRRSGSRPLPSPANIRIRVIPNPSGQRTVYSYNILKICGDVKKITTCYWMGVIPIGRRVEHSTFNPNAKYKKKSDWVTRKAADRLLGR
jgi:hypothetical protein